MSKFAEILLDQKVGNLGGILTYQIPDGLEVKVGEFVDIPLRKGKSRGLIWQITEQQPAYKTKAIFQKTANLPSLQDWQIALLKWLSEYYFCPLHKVLKLFVPAGFLKKKQIKISTTLETGNQIQELHQLTKIQQEALLTIQNSSQKVILLYGITGSGKTEIYCQLTAKNLQQNQQTLILVPEISLTPQTVKNFEQRFGKNIAIIHSKLKPTTKEKAWQAIANGTTKVIIGSRSAIFAPFQNLGTIIIDEEHDDSYKQDQAPRYHAVKVAQKMTELLQLKVVLGSATPALESYYQAENGQFAKAEMLARVNQQGALPLVEVIDLREELRASNLSIFSRKLDQKLRQTMHLQKQAILFLNRRGAASAILCRDCGYVAKCPDCQIAFTYHSRAYFEGLSLNKERMICHHCGLVAAIPHTCPACQSARIRYLGLGTQRVEEEISQKFPHKKIIRADKDTTSTEEDYQTLYQSLRDQKADILIGTQMIGKGLHLPAVTLVGVMLAETTLTIPDFRSAEKTFQLLTQVAGRAGREEFGEVIIQTYLPDHYAIQCARQHDYHQFYQQEIAFRRELNYPPFSKLIKLTIQDQDNQKAQFKTAGLVKKMQEFHTANFPENDTTLHSIVSYPALIPKIRQNYRWIILLSGQNPQAFLQKFSCNFGLDDDIKIDVDPVNSI